ncbi:MAG: ParB/RepB/Spo0J family partition protein [Methylocystis sp.]|uniref:ParB/RepB/Spo0J family partition protein n=1 Tax=Methylocystis sp. TaxID=1911079 RepID=UPI003DA5B5A6
MQISTLPLSSITRISPLNPNQDMASDVSSLAATIRAIGLQYPLTVWPRPDAPGEYEVLDGGRRWRALRQLCNSGSYPDEEYPAVEIHDGDEASALQIALTLSVTPHAKHPVDEFERFALLVERHGYTVEKIAADFGETERHVRQRLALGALAPVVRDLWRDGKISREAAEAFTTGPVAAQEALVDNWRGTTYEPWLKAPYEIRKALRGEVLPEHNPVSRFILRDAERVRAYLAAGGRTTDDLFEPARLCDGPIAERVANELLRAEAQRVADAEGWSRGLIEGDDCGFDFYENEPELTAEEEARLDEIQVALTGDEAVDLDALKGEQEKIMLYATLREFPIEERANLGVGAFINPDGTVSFTRGVAVPPDEAAREPGGDEAESPPGESGESLSPGADASEEEGEADGQAPTLDPLAEPSSKALRAEIEACVTKGLRDQAQRRVDIALMYAVAALGCAYGVTGIGLRPVHARDTEEHDLLKRIRPLSFGDALAECAAAPTNDLTVALASLVAGSIETQGASFAAIGALCGAARARGANLAASMSEAIDRRGFFEAAGKAKTLDIVAALIGPGEKKAVKGYAKDKLAQYAATLAAEKGFLPAPLSNWAALPALPNGGEDAIYAKPEMPLAQAMSDAIAADAAAGKKKRTPRKTPIEKAAERKQSSKAGARA